VIFLDSWAFLGILVCFDRFCLIYLRFNQTGRTRYCSSGPAGFVFDRTRARRRARTRARRRSLRPPPFRAAAPRLSTGVPTARPPAPPPVASARRRPAFERHRIPYAPVRRRLRPHPISAVAAPQATATRPEHCRTQTNSLDPSPPAADAASAAPSSASPPTLHRARRSTSDHHRPRRRYHHDLLLETKPPVPPRAAAVAGIAGGGIAGGGGV
jgi:hypothetical protein